MRTISAGKKTKRLRMALTALVILAMAGGAMLLGAMPVEAERNQEEDKTITTLEDKTHFSGTAPPGETFEVTVYAYSYGDEERVFYTTRVTVGDSGLFDVTLPLPVLGEQYVEWTGETPGRVRYVRLSADLSKRLSEYYVNPFTRVTGE